MRSTVTGFNIFLRGLMEVSIIAAFAYWGAEVGTTTAGRVLLAIFVPIIVFGFWGLVDFHQVGPAGEWLRLLQELALTGLAAAALVVVGQPTLGLTLAILSIAHHALVYSLGERLLKG